MVLKQGHNQKHGKNTTLDEKDLLLAMHLSANRVIFIMHLILLTIVVRFVQDIVHTYIFKYQEAKTLTDTWYKMYVYNFCHVFIIMHYFLEKKPFVCVSLSCNIFNLCLHSSFFETLDKYAHAPLQRRQWENHQLDKDECNTNI